MNIDGIRIKDMRTFVDLKHSKNITQFADKDNLNPSTVWRVVERMSKSFGFRLTDSMGGRNETALVYTDKGLQIRKKLRDFLLSIDNTSPITPDNMDDKADKVLNWAHERNLINGSTAEKQFIKLAEEMGEVAECLAKDDNEGLPSEIGDMLVCMIILAGQKGLAIDECLEAAWNKIKDRKGKMINGMFVKETDL